MIVRRSNPGAEGEKPKAPGRFPAVPDYGKSDAKMLKKEDTFRILDSLIPTSKKLFDMLKPPETLFSLDAGPYEMLSLSSSPDEGISRIASEFLNRPINSKLDFGSLPEYGIYLYSHSSTTFALLWDSGRKVLVHSEIGNASESGSWERFTNQLSNSLRKASTLNKDGERYSFVLNGVAFP